MDHGIQLDSNSYKRYESYQDKWNKLAETKQKDFELFSDKIIIWCKLQDHKNLNISLAPDCDGKSASVADIIIKGSKTLRLSIKNNKDYAKSHRPSGFPLQANLNKELSGEYKNCYNAIIELIYEKYKHLSKFNQITTPMKKEFIYDPVYDLTEQFLKKLNSTELHSYFEFLVGSTGFYQCLNTPKNIVIHDRTEKIPKPTGISCSRNKNGHIVLDFQIEDRNPIQITMRIHSASSKITKNISLKFDAIINTPFYKKQIISKSD